MLNPACRLYIASADAENLDRLFMGDERFFVLGSHMDGQEAISEIMSLCPDAAILDSALVGMDGLEALKILGRMAAPPRVMYLLRGQLPLSGQEPDAAIPYPCANPAEPMERCAKMAESPLPALAGQWESTRMGIAESLLDRLGVSRRLKGRDAMRDGAAALACAPQLGENYRARLYPYLAKRRNTTPRAVERAIRTAVEDTWLRGDLEAIQALFGLTVDAEKGKPTNAEFLSMLAEHVRRETEKAIRE